MKVSVVILLQIVFHPTENICNRIYENVHSSHKNLNSFF